MIECDVYAMQVSVTEAAVELPLNRFYFLTDACGQFTEILMVVGTIFEKRKDAVEGLVNQMSDVEREARMLTREIVGTRAFPRPVINRQVSHAGVAKQADATDLRKLEWSPGKPAMQNCPNSGKPVTWQSRAKPGRYIPAGKV